MTQDEKIILELKKGNHKVFKLLYQYYPMISNMIKKNNGSEEDAKDVFQDAIIIFYKKCLEPQFKLTARISTFLYAIAQKKWRNNFVFVFLNRDIWMNLKRTGSFITFYGNQVISTNAKVNLIG